MDRRQLGHFRRKKRAWAKIMRKHGVPTDLFINNHLFKKSHIHLKIVSCFKTLISIKKASVELDFHSKH